MLGSWAAAAARPWTALAAGSPPAAASARGGPNPAPRPAPGTAPPAPGPGPAPTQRTGPAAGCLRASLVAVQPAQPETMAEARTTADCRLAADHTAAAGGSRRAAARTPAATDIPLRPAVAASRRRRSGRMTPPLHARPSAPTGAPLHMHRSPAVRLLMFTACGPARAEADGTTIGSIGAVCQQPAVRCTTRNSVADVEHNHSTCRRGRGGVAVAAAVVGLLLLVLPTACICLRLPGVQRRRLQDRRFAGSQLHDGCTSSAECLVISLTVRPGVGSRQARR